MSAVGTKAPGNSHPQRGYHLEIYLTKPVNALGMIILGEKSAIYRSFYEFLPANRVRGAPGWAYSQYGAWLSWRREGLPIAANFLGAGWQEVGWCLVSGRGSWRWLLFAF